MKMDRSFKRDEKKFFDVPVSDTSSNYRANAGNFYGGNEIAKSNTGNNF